MVDAHTRALGLLHPPGGGPARPGPLGKPGSWVYCNKIELSQLPWRQFLQAFEEGRQSVERRGRLAGVLGKGSCSPRGRAGTIRDPPSLTS